MLPRFGSDSVADTPTEPVASPAPRTTATTVIVADALAASSPSSQRTDVVPEHEPALDDAETKSRPLPSAVVTTTAVARAGPALRATIVYVTRSPGPADDGETLVVTDTSAVSGAAGPVGPGPAGGARVITTLDSVALPARSEARTAIVFGPTASVRGQLKDVPLIVAAAPLQVTASRPEVASCAVPCSKIALAETVEPAAGVRTASVGAVVSTFTVTDVDASLPALSRAVPVTDLAGAFGLDADGRSHGGDPRAGVARVERDEGGDGVPPGGVRGRVDSRGDRGRRDVGRRRRWGCSNDLDRHRSGRADVPGVGVALVGPRDERVLAGGDAGEVDAERVRPGLRPRRVREPADGAAVQRQLDEGDVSGRLPRIVRRGVERRP